jgi:hypothetical protein
MVKVQAMMWVALSTLNVGAHPVNATKKSGTAAAAAVCFTKVMKGTSPAIVV